MGIRLIPRQALPGLLADDAEQGEKADGAVEATPASSPSGMDPAPAR
jgi:hypothetical protein